jgi:transcription initiation factor IIE alpha subunit
MGNCFSDFIELFGRNDYEYPDERLMRKLEKKGHSCFVNRRDDNSTFPEHTRYYWCGSFERCLDSLDIAKK